MLKKYIHLIFFMIENFFFIFYIILSIFNSFVKNSNVTPFYPLFSFKRKLYLLKIIFYNYKKFLEIFFQPSRMFFYVLNTKEKS